MQDLLQIPTRVSIDNQTPYSKSDNAKKPSYAQNGISLGNIPSKSIINYHNCDGNKQYMQTRVINMVISSFSDFRRYFMIVLIK